MTKATFPVRRTVLLLIAMAGLWAAWHLRLDPRTLAPGSGGLSLLGEFLTAAIRPAITYEAVDVPLGTPPLLMKILGAMGMTIMLATAATSLSFVLGLVLGFFATSSFWMGMDNGRGTLRSRRMHIIVARTGYLLARACIAGARSVHELLWAVLFLSAMGLSNLTAVIAITIPFTGTFAKIFSEMIEESPHEAADALHAAGASPLQAYLFGRFPLILPDLTSYGVYRFECALRSSAVLGFFGIPTLGYYLGLAFKNTHYHEAWSYLYALIAIVALADWWSGVVRRRMQA